jgi:hypothetical protein
MSAVGRLREVAKPRPDSSERPHEAAGPQQPSPEPAARGQKPFEPLLVHLVHMQQTIGRPLAKGAILDVIADDPDALFVAATKEIAAVVVVRRRLVYGLMIVLVGHGDSYLTSRFLAERHHRPKL